MFRKNISMPDNWRSILSDVVRESGHRSTPSYIVDLIRRDLAKRKKIK